MNSTTVTGPATGPVAENRPPASPRVACSPRSTCSGGGHEAAAAFLAQAAGTGIDHVCCGDHVSFFTGMGFDGLVQATALAMLHPTLPVYSGVYLLPLRHPVLVARQLAGHRPARPREAHLRGRGRGRGSARGRDLRVDAATRARGWTKASPSCAGS